MPSDVKNNYYSQPYYCTDRCYHYKTYYDIESVLTFTPSSFHHGKTLQCIISGSQQSATLNVRHGPADGVISIKTRGQGSSLEIECHVIPQNQPAPAINSYVIKADGVIRSQSSSPTTRLSPRPRWCIELSCEGTNALGSTSSTSIYCPRAPPPNDAIQVEFQESGDLREAGGHVDLTISCEIASHTRPFPPINTYVIKRDSQTLSTSNSFTLSPRPDRCTNITCIGENDIGSASSVETFCPKHPPRDHIIDIEFDEGLDDSGRGTVTISCHVNEIDQPFPALERYEIKVGSVTVSNSSSSSFTVSSSPPGCTDITCIGMNELGSTSTVNEFCPTDPPGEDIIALQIEEQIVASEVNLVITCHIEPRDQPTPPIDSYEISVDDETISSSSVPSAIVESRPNKCMNIMCEGRNRRGSTRSTDLYCFRDDIIDVQFNERVGENNGKIYTVVCHIDEEYQPTPGIHTFLITADNVTLSSSRSPSTAFTPRANGGTEVSCTGWNDFGSTTATKTFCPSAVEIIAEFQRQGALQRSSTTYALLVVVFFLSVIVCVAYVNRRRTFFPADEVFKR
ncbi:uncharacterized protein [Diadema antillarum]|uniref:uncharacterized protein n=1 Tax=Diadema antillarum TaxID=105358 RepID=UPI003A84D690